MNRQVTVLLPGDLRKRSGGFGYDRRIVAGLRERGWRVDVHALSARFPQPDARALADAEKQVAALPDGSLVVVDGLAGGAMPEVMQRHRNRLRWVALVHHPLALETGLSAAQRDALMASEQRSLAAVRHTIVTSASTARTLDAWGVAASRISVVEPGTDRPAPALAPGADSTPAAQHGASLLCVASVIPRKGHTVLIEALAGLADRDWTLHCAGDFTPDPDALQALHDAIVAHGLQRRVQLIGEVDDATLDILYRQADVFVLASLHEGFGMAAAEALAYGLPVFTTTAGALPDTVPAGAGVCVPPGDALALRAALARWFDDADWRDQLARGARTAGAQLADWPRACAQFAQVLDAVSQQAAGP
jgi:glycosyltransferase involved in cell wall biosynthesis